MALGQNLKKKKLIPDKQEKKTVAKSSSKVKKKKLIATATKKSPKRKPANKIPSTELLNFISQEAEERRKSLRKRYKTEIENLTDLTVQFLIFKLSEEEYAIEIGKVKEVVITPAISKVPKMPKYIIGLADVRGETVLAVDLAQKFGLTNSLQSNFTLVIEGRKQRVGLLLAEIPLALKVQGKNISSSISYLAEGMEDMYVKGLIKLDHRLIHYLDVDELLDSDKATVIPDHLMNKL